MGASGRVLLIQFLHASAGDACTPLGNLAADRRAIRAVREFGRTLVSGHSKVRGEVLDVGRRIGIRPTASARRSPGNDATGWWVARPCLPGFVRTCRRRPQGCRRYAMRRRCITAGQLSWTRASSYPARASAPGHVAGSRAMAACRDACAGVIAGITIAAAATVRGDLPAESVVAELAVSDARRTPRLT